MSLSKHNCKVYRTHKVQYVFYYRSINTFTAYYGKCDNGHVIHLDITKSLADQLIKDFNLHEHYTSMGDSEFKTVPDKRTNNVTKQ